MLWYKVFGRQLLIVEMGIRRVTLFDFTSSWLIVRDNPIGRLLLSEEIGARCLNLCNFSFIFSVGGVLPWSLRQSRASELGRSENLPLDERIDHVWCPSSRLPTWHEERETSHLLLFTTSIFGMSLVAIENPIVQRVCAREFLEARRWVYWTFPAPVSKR